MERRETPRKPVTLLVEYSDATDLSDDYTANLSEGGTFVYTERELAHGTCVDLILSFPGLVKPLQLSGVVRWTTVEHGRAGAGIEFMGHDDVARARLCSVIDAMERGDHRFVDRGTARVLVIEDNPHLAGLIMEGLKMYNRAHTDGRRQIKAVLAPNGRDALASIEKQSFDTLIVDLYVPIVSGREIISRLRSTNQYNGTPIIAMSGAGDGAEEDAFKAGCDFFVPKPFKLKSLLGLLDQALASSQR